METEIIRRCEYCDNIIDNEADDLCNDCAYNEDDFEYDFEDDDDVEEYYDDESDDAFDDESSTSSSSNTSFNHYLEP